MEDSYRARALVSVSEGPMYGPGEDIAGAFDPDDEHNARLIESGQITRLGSVQKAAPAEPAAEAAEAPAEAEPPAEAAASPGDGGEGPSPTIEPMSEKPKPKSRRRS